MSEFKIGPLNHVGVAVPDLEEACETYRTLYGATDITTPFDMPEQGVKVCFVNLPNSQIELIEPLNEESPIHNFIQKNPKGGQHHVCFEVDDIKLPADARPNIKIFLRMAVKARMDLDGKCQVSCLMLLPAPASRRQTEHQ